MAEASLYQKLGGMPAVNLAVDKFYDKVLADDRIKHFFVNTNMDRMRDHQKKFLTYAFGGVAGYDGQGMREAHAGLVKNMGLNDTHFDAVVENLGSVLADLGVKPELIGEVAAIAESVRNDVLGR